MSKRKFRFFFSFVRKINENQDTHFMGKKIVKIKKKELQLTTLKKKNVQKNVKKKREQLIVMEKYTTNNCFK